MKAIEIVAMLKKRGEHYGVFVLPSWGLYKTVGHGYAVHDRNATEWRAVILKKFRKADAIRFLNKNNIEWRE